MFSTSLLQTFDSPEIVVTANENINAAFGGQLNNAAVQLDSENGNIDLIVDADATQTGSGFQFNIDAGDTTTAVINGDVLIDAGSFGAFSGANAIDLTINGDVDTLLAGSITSGGGDIDLTVNGDFTSQASSLSIFATNDENPIGGTIDVAINGTLEGAGDGLTAVANGAETNISVSGLLQSLDVVGEDNGNGLFSALELVGIGNTVITVEETGQLLSPQDDAILLTADANSSAPVIVDITNAGLIQVDQELSLIHI